jgi:uncharacterized protein (TIGR02452 family)
MLPTSQPYYHANERQKSCTYTDHVIYTPRAVVIRNDAGTLLEQPYYASIITAPAVNAGVVDKREGHGVVRPIMHERIRRILTIAQVHKIDILILGAFGCGVFRNDPSEVAQIFAGHLNGAVCLGAV